jgi:hypothetical protein
MKEEAAARPRNGDRTLAFEESCPRFGGGPRLLWINSVKLEKYTGALMKAL